MYIEYHDELSGEVPFIHNGKKYVYVWGKYPQGKVDIAVYCYGSDLCLDYRSFRSNVLGIEL